MNKKDIKDINNLGLNSPTNKRKYLNFYNIYSRRYKIDEEKNIKALENKEFSSNEIRNYYIDKKRDYSSLIHNKGNNSIFIKKYRRKYEINTSLIFNQKNQNKISILPKINKKYHYLIVLYIYNVVRCRYYYYFDKYIIIN